MFKALITWENGRTQSIEANTLDSLKDKCRLWIREEKVSCIEVYEVKRIGYLKLHGEETSVKQVVQETRMKCPICNKEMKERIEKRGNDAFVCGYEEVIAGWDCSCGISLDMYEK